MSRKLTWMGVPLLALALVAFCEAPAAQAQGFSLRIGRFGISNYGHPYGAYRVPVYRSRYGGHYGSFYGGHYGHHPRRPHYDYHPPQLIPHRGHLDYVPGHYDLHHGNHWHH